MIECYHLTLNNVSIPADKLGEALYLIDYLHSDDQLREYAEFVGQTNDEEYAYPNVRNPGPGGFPSLEEALEAWNLYGDKTLEGTMVISGFIDLHQELGALHILIDRLAPVLNPKAVIEGPPFEFEWFRWSIRDGKLVEEYPDPEDLEDLSMEDY